MDDGAYACHAAWSYETEEKAPFLIADEALSRSPGIRLTDPDTRVFCSQEGTPMLTLHDYGKGRAVYMGGFTYSPRAARMLLEMLLYLTGTEKKQAGLTSDPMTECAWFSRQQTLVVMNNADTPTDTTVALPDRDISFHLDPYETVFQSAGKA